MNKQAKFYGWNMVGVLWLVYFLMQGLVLYGEPVINTFMVIHMDWSRSVLGMGTTTFALLQGIAGPLVAWIIVKKGIRFTITIGSIIVAISALLMATVVDTPWKYIVGFGVLSGVGLGFSGMFSVQSGINYWFREKRALALSIALTGAGVGGFVVGHIFESILKVSGGNWHIGWWFIVFTSCISAVIAWVFIKNKPSDIGQVPDGIAIEKAEKNEKNRHVYKAKIDMPITRVIKDRNLWFIIIAIVALRFGYKLCVGHGVIHLLDQGITTGVAATSLGTMSLFSVLGRLAAGMFADRIEPRYVWTAGMVSFVIGFLSLMYSTDAIHVMIYAAGVGLGWGISYVSYSAMIANYFGTNTFPQAMGIVFPCQQIIGSLAPVTAGLLFDFTGSYMIAFDIVLALMGVGIIVIMLAKPPQLEEQKQMQPIAN